MILTHTALGVNYYMAEEQRNPNGTVRRTRTSQPQKKRRRRSSGAKAAAAFLYVLVVIGVSAVLATVGWSWANDLLSLNKDETSAVIEIPESVVTYTEVTDDNGVITTESRVDMNYVTDQLKDAGLVSTSSSSSCSACSPRQIRRSWPGPTNWTARWITGRWCPT